MTKALSGSTAAYLRLESVTYPGGRVVEYDYGQGTAGNAYDADRIDFALGRVYRITSDDATPLVYAEYSYLGDGTIVSVAHPEVEVGLRMTVGTGDGQINVGQTVYNFSGGSPTGAEGVVVGQTDDYWWIQVTTGTWSETGVISLEASGTPANYMSYTDSDAAAGLALTYGQPDDANGGFAGLDRFGRVIDQRWTLGGAADASFADGYAVDHYSYTYDRNSSRLTRANEIDDDFSEAYTYDGLNRLTAATRGGQGYQTWTLDALGNWSDSWFDADDDGQVDQGESQYRGTNDANEITSMTGRDAGEPAYDSAGNMIFDGQQHYRYDAWNRLTQAYADDAGDPGQPGDLIAVYQYDGRGYRLSKAVARYESLDPHIVTGYDRTDFLFNDSWQVLEERTAANVGTVHVVATTPNVQYVMDIRYIDAVVCRFRDTDSDGDTDDETLYYTNDANMNVTALVNLAGMVVESYAYDPYGETIIISPSPYQGEGWGEGDVIITSAVFNTVTYAGYHLNPETGLYDVRHRVLSAKVSWLTRDPLLYSDSAHLYEYVTSDPISTVDPYGLASTEELELLLPSAPSNRPTVNGRYALSASLVHREITRRRPIYKRPGGIWSKACDAKFKAQLPPNVTNVAWRIENEKLHIRDVTLNPAARGGNRARTHNFAWQIMVGLYGPGPKTATSQPDSAKADLVLIKREGKTFGVPDRHVIWAHLLYAFVWKYDCVACWVGADGKKEERSFQHAMPPSSVSSTDEAGHMCASQEQYDTMLKWARLKAQEYVAEFAKRQVLRPGEEVRLISIQGPREMNGGKPAGGNREEMPHVDDIMQYVVDDRK